MIIGRLAGLLEEKRVAGCAMLLPGEGWESLLMDPKLQRKDTRYSILDARCMVEKSELQKSGMQIGGRGISGITLLYNLEDGLKYT